MSVTHSHQANSKAYRVYTLHYWYTSVCKNICWFCKWIWCLYFKFDAAKTLKFNMDPLENNSNFISDPEIDPYENHYRFVLKNILDYSDSNQLSKILNNVNSVNLESILYLNAQNLCSHQDIFYTNLKCVQHKFSVLAFCETHTDISTETETSIEISGYLI